MNSVPGRKTTEVAVGVLLRPDRAVLLADRPAGKPYPGYWEFPGGKIEPGESVEHALARELHEELGIEAGPATPWVTFEFDYPHAYVRLHFCRIYDWRGTPQGREGQQLGYFRLDEPPPQPLLPAAVPALRWLSLPEVGAAVCIGRDPESATALLDRALARGMRLVIVRAAPGADPQPMAAVLPVLQVRARAHGARLISASGLPAGPDGRLLEAAALPTAGRVADWVGAAITDAEALQRAARAGCDFALHGPVLVPADGRPAVGWHGARALLRNAPLPVLLEGGLIVDDLVHARAAGAHGVVVDAQAL